MAFLVKLIKSVISPTISDCDFEKMSSSSQWACICVHLHMNYRYLCPTVTVVTRHLADRRL